METIMKSGHWSAKWSQTDQNHILGLRQLSRQKKKKRRGTNILGHLNESWALNFNSTTSLEESLFALVLADGHSEVFTTATRVVRVDALDLHERAVFLILLLTVITIECTHFHLTLSLRGVSGAQWAVSGEKTRFGFYLLLEG
jgi:hypothetical protein